MLKINNYIESIGYRTFYAPRDIPFGSAYPEAIIELINRCDIFLLIFSASSQNSTWVKKELERAISKNKYVIPMRIENVDLDSYMEFLISNTQWIDAHNQLFDHSANKLEQHLKTLSVKFGKTTDSDKTNKIQHKTKTQPISAIEKTVSDYSNAKSLINKKNMRMPIYLY